MPEQSNYSICYEAIQRIYRNAVVDYAREALNQAYGESWGKQVQRAYEAEWPDMVAKANQAVIIGFIGAPLVDEIDYLGVNHFHQLFEKFFDEIFPTVPGTDATALRQAKNWTLTWQKQIQALRNSIAHPATDDLPFDFAQDGLGDAAKILKKIGKTREETQIRDLMKMLHDGSKSPPPGPPPGPGPGKPPIISAQQDVLVVPAGRYARDDYEKYHAYICQPNRAFRPVPRMAFYDHGVILPYVPTIEGVVESVSFSDRGFGDIERARLDSAAAEKAMKLLRTVLAEEDSWASRDRTQFKMVLLSGPDDQERTFRLLAPIVNDMRSKRGRPAAFVQAQRYVSFAKLQTHPKVTSQLE